MTAQLTGFEEKSKKAIIYLQEKLQKLRTGRANPALVEDLLVDAYDSKMQLKNLAAINVPEPRMIIVQPWDASVIPAIEKAILISNLGLSPNTDKNIIRLMIPQLTEERRQDLIKLMKGELEETRIKIRGFRRETIEELEINRKKAVISEDEEHRFKNELQKEVEKYNAEIEQIGAKKETELHEV